VVVAEAVVVMGEVGMGREEVTMVEEVMGREAVEEDAAVVVGVKPRRRLPWCAKSRSACKSKGPVVVAVVVVLLPVIKIH
jgi:hypothetical protein